MFKLVFSEEALRQLKDIENKNVKRILNKLKESSDKPLHYFKRLTGREEYKLRVGDYRIIANIMQNEEAVFIRSIGHRKNIYKEER
jgi:mRNA interferase RelE/StbE